MADQLAFTANAGGKNFHAAYKNHLKSSIVTPEKETNIRKIHTLTKTDTAEFDEVTSLKTCSRECYAWK